jgi:signal transduction histidine kinase
MLSAAFAALCVGWFISHKILIPIRQLNTATHLVAAGDLETTVNVKNKDEIGQLADAFNQMTNSLRKDRDLRQQMTADIAHELRNPLTIIMGNAEAISEGILPPTKEAMEVIYDEAKHLSVLVDDLRTLSLSEAGELHLQKSLVNLKELFDRLALSFALKVAEKQATLSIVIAPDVPHLLADAGRLSQIFSNLLNNSIKHIDAGGKVVMSAALSHGPYGEELVQIDVADNGAGIPAEDLPFIFDRFYRARNRSNRLLDGTGLGLAISRSLVENHGGTIGVVSDPGKRTVFSVTLPVGGGGDSPAKDA